ncbi:hypothetical protein [Streptomyces sp. cg35]|uniref:hypothetical protein n=1 Tax=Streptomyces sp. cg35 TaxID=3421650 RepID=UPI003D16B913
MARNPSRHRLTDVLIIGFSLAVGASIGVQLYWQHVTWGLIVPCVLAAASSSLWLLSKVAEAFESTVHRCTAPGCTFRVRVQNVDAAENRRWQEVAAAHPTHDHS